MSRSEDIPLHLLDMRLAAQRIGEIVEETSLASVKVEWRYVSILERQVEIISEASRKLSEIDKAAFPDIPWKQIAGIGNILRHEYKRVDIAILWEVASIHMPPLLLALEALIAQNPES